MTEILILFVLQVVPSLMTTIKTRRDECNANMRSNELFLVLVNNSKGITFNGENISTSYIYKSELHVVVCIFIIKIFICPPVCIFFMLF